MDWCDGVREDEVELDGGAGVYVKFDFVVAAGDALFIYEQSKLSG